MLSLYFLPVVCLNNVYNNFPSFFHKTWYYAKYSFLNFYKTAATVSNHSVYFFQEYLYLVFFFFKKHSLLRYQQLTDISCIDSVSFKNRFMLNYCLLSFLNSDRLFFSLELQELDTPYSISPLFKGANWYEREVWDMFGIFFQKNKDMRRILTDYGFSGHPLRKDFPLSGFIELFYDDSKKKLVYNKIALTQEYRFFSFSNPWKLSK